MSKKIKMMQFVDGLKEISLNQMVAYDNGQSGQHFRLIESGVLKIGRSLVTLANGDKFYLETGARQSNYTCGRLYSSKEVYIKGREESQIISKIKYKISHYNTKITYEQALAINEIMGWDFDKNEERVKHG